MAHSKTTWVNNDQPYINAEHLNNLETQYDDAMADVAAAVPVIATPIGLAVSNVVSTKLDGLDIALRGDFATADLGTTFKFPKNSVQIPNGTYAKTDVIDATTLASSTSLNGTVTSGSQAVATTTTGAPVFTTDAGQTSFKITSGIGAVSFASSVNQVAFKITSLPSFSSGIASGQAAFLRSTLGATSYLYGSYLTSSGNYELAFFSGAINDPTGWKSASSGTGAAAGYASIVSIAKAAAVGDLGVLNFDPATSIMTLKVNGTIVKQGTLSSGQIANMGLRVGAWGRYGSTVQIPGYEWLGAVTENTTTVVRNLLTTDTAGNLSTDSLLKIETFLNSRAGVGALFDIRKYGAKCDGILLKDGAMTAGSNILSSPSRAFTSADVGKRVGVIGVKPIVANVNSNGVVVASIGSVVSGNAILSQNADVTASGLEVMFGTLDDAAYNSARDAAFAAGGGSVLTPVGNTIVAATHVPKDGVSYVGADRFGAQVWPLKNTDASSSQDVIPIGGWLFSWSTSGLNSNAVDYLRNVDVHDFTVQCRFWCAATSYSSSLKPLNLFKLNNSHIYRMNVYDSPATAIPWDNSIASHVHHNLIVNPGRLAPSGIGPGGSGIGVGTGNHGSGSEWIAFNTIIGTQTASVAGAGQNGIFVEAQTAITDLNATIVEPINVIGNTVIGMPYGISEAGGVGTLITSNQLIGCGVGIAVRYTDLPSSAPGIDANIHHNTIRDCAGPSSVDGTGILIRTGAGHPLSISALNALVESNTILRSARYGIWLLAQSVGIDGVRIIRNDIRDSGLSAIRVTSQISSGTYAQYRQLQIDGNQLHSNGKLGTIGNRAAILIDPTVTWLGGYLQSRRGIYDLAPTPTQVDTVVTTGATLTNVEKDPAPIYWP